MTDPAASPGVDRLRTAVYVLAASVVGMPLIVLLLTQAVLHQVNPRGLDLSDPRAYEVELWVPCLSAAVGMLIAIAVVFARYARLAADPSVLRYPGLVVQLQAGFAIAAVALLLLTP